MNNRKNEALLATLTDRYFSEILSQNNIRQVDRKAISSAAKNMAFEFANVVIEREMGRGHYTRTTFEEDKLKYHVENMCDMLGIDSFKMFGKTKGRMEISTSRMVIIHLLRKEFGKVIAHENILAQLFNRNRSSILHNLKTAKTMLQVKDAFFLGVHDILKDYKFERVHAETENKGEFVSSQSQAKKISDLEMEILDLNAYIARLKSQSSSLKEKKSGNEELLEMMRIMVPPRKKEVAIKKIRAVLNGI